MDTPQNPRTAVATMASALERRNNIISAVQSSYGFSNDRIRSTITKIIIPETVGVCRKWIFQVKRSGEGGLLKSGLNLNLVTDFSQMIKWWVDYNLWAHFFCQYIHQPQFEELENLDPEFLVFLESEEIAMLATKAIDEERTTPEGSKHEESSQRDETIRLTGESQQDVDPGLLSHGHCPQSWV
ncbi:hypothetical protein SMACR_09815 [Sordaria macrospora]|uniref:Uncharacterized protein n=1 Tax=Sordaria macrospora TaxID=5147 RepID=A0A8S8ZRN6_SORMA|nr:hypothetical protein SMACR_09815 [Sordaria macrospora]WPJ59507.1 hypothetical protein SMAC4_09815 [Sordaria macrospora]